VDFTCFPTDSVQAVFDNFYGVSLGLLDHFYPERSITVRSRDPPYITPYIRSLLRKKNRLMRAGRVEKAGAIARRVGKEITKRNRTRLQKYNGRTDGKDMWAAVRQFTGRQQHPVHVPDGIDADCLNKHYADISTDREYDKPPLKLTAVQEWSSGWLNESRMFRILDTLKPTASGLDGLPAWFLRLGAPVFSKILADLINMSINMSTVPRQWKQARICPVPKHSRVTTAQSPSLQCCHVSPRRSLYEISCIQLWTVRLRRSASRTSSLFGRVVRLLRHLSPFCTLSLRRWRLIRTWLSSP